MRSGNRNTLYIFVLASVLVALASRADDIPSQIWEAFIGQEVDSSPAIASDGTIYVSASGYIGFSDMSGGKLAAFTHSGKRKWMFKTSSDIKSSPAIGDDGTIYFGSRDRRLYALNPAGEKKWSFETGSWVDASAAIAKDGTIYFGGWDTNFYALNPDGTKKWMLATGGPIESSAAIAKDGTIYFGSHDRIFYALNPDGSTRWKFPTGGAILSSPALDVAGNIYFTSTDGNLYALNPDGSKKWSLWTGGIETPSPVLDGDGNIYLGVNNMFWGISSTGKKKWDFGHPTIYGAATIAADGMIFFCGINEGAGVLYGFTPDGINKSYISLNGEAKSSPVISEDGTIYVGAYYFHALKQNIKPAKTGWPKFRGGPKQTGRADLD
ncbi:MAG TPA: PQQ-binding-like beta-propeller repeat protein [Verrucomicrobiae bacterium]|jgi:outer membrane protein assembly factor BamB|nr:PQQ-binding-like beta-propeller repeat protein [Verrucomicrobiae bacterium]